MHHGIRSAVKVLCVLVLLLTACTAGRPERSKDAGHSHNGPRRGATYGLWADRPPSGSSALTLHRTEVLGIGFTSNSPGQVDALKVFTADPRVVAGGELFAGNGRPLARVVFRGTTAGWRTAALRQPVFTAPAQRYVLAIKAQPGRYLDVGAPLAGGRTVSHGALTADGEYAGHGSGMPRNPVRRAILADVRFCAFPGAGDTGVPPGVGIKRYRGPMVIRTPGTVLDAVNVVGDLRVQAPGVIIKRSKIFGDVRIDASDVHAGYSFTIIDSEVSAGDALGHDAYDGTGIGAVDFTARRVDVRGGKRGINCFAHCTVVDSWVHGQAADPTGVEHESAVRMGSNSTITHNTLECTAPNVPPQAGCSGDLTGYGDFAPVRDNLVLDNLFEPTTGATCAYGGSTGAKTYSTDASGIRFVGNVFERRQAASDHGQHLCGYYFTVADFDSGAPGNRWLQNTYPDGTPVPAG